MPTILEDRRITYDEMLMFCTIHRDQIFVRHSTDGSRPKNTPISKVPFEDVIMYMQTWYENSKFPYRSHGIPTATATKNEARLEKRIPKARIKK